MKLAFFEALIMTSYQEYHTGNSVVIFKNISAINESTSTNISLPESDFEDGFYYYEDIEKLRTAWVNEPHFVPQTVIYGVVFLLGIIGNGTVIFSVLGSRTARFATFTFMVSLAVADILFLLVVIPHELLRMVLGEWPGTRAFCKISGFIEMLTAVASILNLTAVSFERYFVIVMPIQSRRRCTVRNTRKLLVFVWILSILLSIPAMVVKDTQSTTYYNNDTTVTLMFCADHGLQDQHRMYYAVYQLAIMFLVPTALMTFCYTVVIYVLWISGRTLYSLTSNQPSVQTTTRYRGIALRESDGSSSSNCASATHFRSKNITETTINKNVRESIMKGRKQVIKMLITVILVFLFCWGPKLIFRIMKYSEYKVHMHTTTHFRLQIVIYCLPYVQSCLNPVIYGFMSKNFRKSVVTSCNNHVLIRQCRPRPSPLAELEMDTKYSNGVLITRNINSASST
ncbi:G-protein coupled receptor 54-like [Mya arenaria]|uniref:G-protein coupled receptor 54-like n=1 Tax=Mya arenaria TaxID=6604 RepID=UPI0022E0D0BF|nr:G-protein coupled receptor 54-like [Mya arenaria]